MSLPFPLLWLIPVLPLLGALINGALSLGGASSRHGPARAFVSLVAVLMPALSFVLTLNATGRLASHPGGGNVALTQHLWDWFSASGSGFSFKLSIGLLFDRLTSMMLLFVTGIGTLIHLYSVGYMGGDRGYARFMAYMNLFMFSMIVLVIGDSLVTTFLGWEGVGLCSYLLIGFWHKENAYNDAARKAFVVNRIGDLGFLIGAFMLFQVMSGHGTPSLMYRDISSWFQDLANAKYIMSQVVPIGIAGLFIFIGCTGKSAQIPLVTWLPDAMAGPTPVSALIHAATMVTAGVYLLARLCDVYAHATAPLLFGLTVNQMILIIATATAAWGAIAGLLQTDIKKALAYSTVSQLGFMFMAAGVGAYDVALFHVFTHAFFKATLFLGAGSVIQGLHHEQDMRRMGGLTNLMPVTFLWMFWAWYAIIGGPVLGAGSFSKDLILERLFAGGDFAPVIGGIAVIIALLTAVYMTRIMCLTFWSPSRMSPEERARVKDPPLTMIIPLCILGFGCMISGWVWANPDFGMSSLLTLGHPAGIESRQASGLHLFRDWLAPVLGSAQDFAVHAQAGPGMRHGHEAVAMEGGPLGGYGMVVLGALAAGIGAWIAALRWRGGKVDGPATGDLVGFSATWTRAFDIFYEWTVIPVTKISAWILAWVIDQALGGLIVAWTALMRLFGELFASLQLPRLRSSLALSMVGATTLIALLLLQGMLAWVVAVCALAVATIYLLLESPP